MNRNVTCKWTLVLEGDSMQVLTAVPMEHEKKEALDEELLGSRFIMDDEDPYSYCIFEIGIDSLPTLIEYIALFATKGGIRMSIRTDVTDEDGVFRVSSTLQKSTSFAIMSIREKDLDDKKTKAMLSAVNILQGGLL